MPNLDRTRVSFSQAEGIVEIPSQLQLREISTELRSYLWLVVFNYLKNDKEYPEFSGDTCLADPSKNLVRSYWIRILHRFADEYSNDDEEWIKIVGTIFKRGAYNEVFDFLTFALRGKFYGQQFEREIALAMDRGRAAYFVEASTIFPKVTEEDRRTISGALTDALESGFTGARSHLIAAGVLLSDGDPAGSVRESIHAVESVVTKLSGKGTTLSAAILVLEKARSLNPNLRRAISALYDYTSDEKGVRHAKIFEGVDVTENEALYMISVCAAFVSYAVRTIEGK